MWQPLRSAMRFFLALFRWGISECGFLRVLILLLCCLGTCAQIANYGKLIANSKAFSRSPDLLDRGKQKDLLMVHCGHSIAKHLWCHKHQWGEPLRFFLGSPILSCSAPGGAAIRKWLLLHSAGAVAARGATASSPPHPSSSALPLPSPIFTTPSTPQKLLCWPAPQCCGCVPWAQAQHTGAFGGAVNTLYSSLATSELGVRAYCLHQDWALCAQSSMAEEFG